MSASAVRILVLNQYFHPDVASTSRLLTELCEDLARHHEVTVVCGRPSYDPVEHRPPSGLVFEDRHEDVRVLRTWSTRFGRGSMAGRLANYARDPRCSVLFSRVTSGHPPVLLQGAGAELAGDGEDLPVEVGAEGLAAGVSLGGCGPLAPGAREEQAVGADDRSRRK